MPSRVTKFDQAVNLVKDHPVAAAVLLLAVAVIGAGEFIGSWGVISRLWSSQAPPPVSCRYLVLDPFDTYPTLKVEIRWAYVTIDERTFTYDGGDIRSPRAFVLKDYDAQRHDFRAEMRYEGDAHRPINFAADLNLDAATFLRVKWDPFTQTANGIRHVEIRGVSENEFRRVLGSQRPVLPSCTALAPGITEM